MTSEFKKGVNFKRVYIDNVAFNGSAPSTVNFVLPSDFHRSYGVVLVRAWPLTTWNNAIVTVAHDNTLSNVGSVDLYSPVAQSYGIVLHLMYE